MQSPANDLVLLKRIWSGITILICAYGIVRVILYELSIDETPEFGAVFKPGVSEQSRTRACSIGS